MKKYLIGKFLIDIPDDHKLPIYQAEHPMYDRFLPFLLKEIEFQPNDSVCIVGSNIGDTLAALCDIRPEFTFLNFEADSGFFKFLEANSRLIHSISKSNIVNENFFVGKDAKISNLVGEGGTKHAVLANDSELNYIRLVGLDSSLPLYLLGTLKLLIVDVDGFDWDVLNSAHEIISKENPLIFFELYANDSYTLTEYYETLKMLESLDYFFSVFDNFGNLMLEVANYQLVESLARYVYSQNSQATRTIYYLDILATPRKDKTVTTAAIVKFRSYIFD